MNRKKKIFLSVAIVWCPALAFGQGNTGNFAPAPAGMINHLKEPKDSFGAVTGWPRGTDEGGKCIPEASDPEKQFKRLSAEPLSVPAHQKIVSVGQFAENILVATDYNARTNAFIKPNESGMRLLAETANYYKVSYGRNQAEAKAGSGCDVSALNDRFSYAYLKKGPNVTVKP